MHSSKQSFDFHCHSTASDGSKSPAQLAELAEHLGLNLWSLTDHDTIAGYLDLAANQTNTTSHLVSGVELSCVWSGITLHVLAFDFDPQASGMEQLLRYQRQRREQRAKVIGERTENKLKLPNAYAQACKLSGNAVPARPHFAQLFINKGIVDSAAEAFKRYLGAGKWGDVKLCWPGLEEVLTAVRSSAGISVVAHPFHYRMTATKLRRLLDEFTSHGGRGVELAVPNVNSGQYGWLIEELQRRGLAQSGGSDYHGKATPWAKLGHFPNLAKRLTPVQELFSLQ